MSNLDLSALKAAEEDLKSRNSGGGRFIRLAEGETKDIRILDPKPNMNGLYYVEVPIWWVDGKPITSPSFIGESDLVQDIIDDIEQDFIKDDTKENPKGAIQFKKLKNATKGQGQKLLSKTSGFWIPVLEFEWVVKNNQIDGVTDADGNYDTALIRKYIKDGKPKIFDAKMSLLKDITAQLTTGRAGATFLDQDKGYNLIVMRAGTGRDTKYTAQRDEQMPMPAEFYGPDSIDVVKAAKATIFTEAYTEAILNNYFYGDELPKEPEYRFPELRENDEEAEAAPTSRRRRGAAAPADEAKEEVKKETAADEKAEAAPTRSRRGAAEETKAAPAGRRRRSLVDDVNNSTNGE